MKKRIINLIVIHALATKPLLSKTVDVAEVRKWHTTPKSKGGRGWSDIGYHFLIKGDCSLERGRPLERSGAHAVGYNKNSIGIAYAGGLDERGRPADTRTDFQKEALKDLIKDILSGKYSDEIQLSDEVRIVGHRDLSPDLNGDGIISPSEFSKACPCFNAIEEYKDLVKK